MAPEQQPPRPSRAETGRTALRIPLLMALLVSASAAFFLQPRVIAMVRAEKLPALALIAAPAAFAIVVVIAALDIWRQARRTGYFRGPNVVMLAGAVAFLGLLLPDTVEEYRARTSAPVDSVAHYDALFLSDDPRVRALVMEVAGFRPGANDAIAALLVKGLDDGDPLVELAAIRAVAHRAQAPLEGPDGKSKAREIAVSWMSHAP